MRVARRQDVLRVVRCGIEPSSRVRARTPPVQNLIHGRLNVVYTRFKADEDILDALVHLKEKNGAGGAGGSNWGRASPGDAALEHGFSPTMPGSSGNRTSS